MTIKAMMICDSCGNEIQADINERGYYFAPHWHRAILNNGEFADFCSTKCWQAWWAKKG
jgi:hypothetical protein